jgi:hypothetical protein
LNHNKKSTTLAIAAIAATMALTAATLTIPQQALAWGHHHHHHHDNGIKVDQQVNQLNVCSGQAPDHVELVRASGALCVNQGNNNADIQK